MSERIMVGGTSKRKDFVARSLSGMTGALERAMYSEDQTRRVGLLQGLDPRAKLLTVFALIATAALAHHLTTIALIYGIVLVLALLSHLPLGDFAKKGWLGITVFSGVVFIPVLFLLPGEPLLVILAGPTVRLAVTDNGLASATILVVRVGTCVSLALLLVSTTRWVELLRGLGELHVPEAFVVVLGMTYRYLFLLLHTANNLFLGRSSRSVGTTSGAEQRRWVGSAAGVLLSRSVKLSTDVHMAMQARGFGGQIRTLSSSKMRDEDWLLLLLVVVGAAGLLLLDGRMTWI